MSSAHVLLVLLACVLAASANREYDPTKPMPCMVCETAMESLLKNLTAEVIRCEVARVEKKDSSSSPKLHCDAAWRVDAKYVADQTEHLCHLLSTTYVAKPIKTEFITDFLLVPDAEEPDTRDDSMEKMVTAICTRWVLEKNKLEEMKTAVIRLVQEGNATPVQLSLTQSVCKKACDPHMGVSFVDREQLLKEKAEEESRKPKKEEEQVKLTADARPPADEL